jgi:cold shock CspA family protein
MTGRVGFYDEPTAWGVITGDDGHFYVVRGNQIVAPSPQLGERITFEPQKTSSGLRAVNVRRAEPPPTGVRDPARPS